MTSTSASTHSAPLSFEQKLQNYADLTVQVGAGLSVSGPSAGQRVRVQGPLKAGEQKVVHFTITEDDLKFFNAQLKYAAEPGKFNVQIGLDSQDVTQQSFELL